MNMIPRMLWLTAALVLSMATVVGADQTDQRLDELFQTLQTSSDTDKLLAVESEIWEIW